MAPPLVLLAGLAGWAVDPLAPLILDRRRRRGKEDPARLGERLGHPGKPRPGGPLIWLHAASVGEVTAALPLIDALLARHDDVTVLVTTGTVTSANLVADRLPDRALHQFVPVDVPRRLARFLDHWRPDAALIVEQEWWPNTLTALRRRGIPAGLLSARLTERTTGSWRRWPAGIRHLLDTFQVVIPGGAAMAERLQRLGVAADRLAPPCNLKFAASPVDRPAARRTLADAIGDRPVWTAFSIHGAEIGSIVEAIATIRRDRPRALVLLAPRKPQEVAAIAEALTAAGLTFCRRSTGALPQRDDPVYLIDGLGEAGTILRAAPVAFIGGSLAPGPGGHNVLEALACGAVPLYGPHMENFSDIAGALDRAGGGIAVDDGAALAAAVDRLLADPDDRAAVLAAGQAVLAGQRATVVDRSLDALAPVLSRVPGWPTPATTASAGAAATVTAGGTAPSSPPGSA